MAAARDDALARAIAREAHPLRGAPADFDPLMELIAGARCVLIGEATHGTHEFYRLRAQLTKRLIVEKHFSAVAAEADWPDAYRVNRYVRRSGSDASAVESLAGFRRFPAWMWRNADVLDFTGWLREHNESLPAERSVGFYGLDLYSLNASMDAVVTYLDAADPDAATRARYRYSCFEDFGEDTQAYGYSASLGLARDCEEVVIAQLVEMQAQRDLLLRRDGIAAEDDYFQAEQNARVVKNAHEYYRSMFHGRVSSWNLRDTHMADTLVLVGFSTHPGTVTAASESGGPAARRHVREGLSGSYEDLFHRTGVASFLLFPRRSQELAGQRVGGRLQRAIGVIYRPETERQSHYFHVRLPEQFDAMIHIDETRALEPLERTAHWERGEAPETFPSGV